MRRFDVKCAFLQGHLFGGDQGEEMYEVGNRIVYLELPEFGQQERP